jgi:hypothetical protein
VCPTHAREFWTAFFADVKSRSTLCKHHNRLSTCSACRQLSASKEQKAAAIAAAGPPPAVLAAPPAVAARVQIRRAS